MSDDATEAPEVDWSVLEDKRIEPILEQVATKIGKTFRDTTTYDDAYQEGMVILASNAARVREYLEDVLVGERHVWRWLHSRVFNVMETPANRACQTISLAQLTEHEGESD